VQRVEGGGRGDVWGRRIGRRAVRVSYAGVGARASRQENIALMEHTDRVAEIQNTVRQSPPILLTATEAHESVQFRQAVAGWLLGDAQRQSAKFLAGLFLSSYALDLTTTLQRLMRQPAGKLIHCSIMGPSPVFKPSWISLQSAKPHRQHPIASQQLHPSLRVDTPTSMASPRHPPRLPNMGEPARNTESVGSIP